MKNYIKHDEWAIVEEGFHKDCNLISESIFSIGNGRFGQRANFEEHFSGQTLQGNYVAGVYYPDKTRVGWWKNGYPEYFAKVLNAVNWIGIDIDIDGETLDLNTCDIHEFRRELNMKEGFLKRSFTATMPNSKKVKVTSTRFCSIANDEIGAVKYSIVPVNFDGKANIIFYMDFDVVNQDSNYGEKFWKDVEQETEDNQALITARTKKSNFAVCAGMLYDIYADGEIVKTDSQNINRTKYVGSRIALDLEKGKQLDLYKYATITSCQNHERADLPKVAKANLRQARKKGYDLLLQEQASAWMDKWKESDIVIEGDVAAQQGIRFNIFQMNQTYTGEDSRLNIGPKGFTGEKYGGSTYWDTEAFCLPFYLSTANEAVSRNLLMYRHKHLPRAIENAEKLGFNHGAALFPMVTINGEECHNEWEITFEEIHRNGAIAYAIYEYTNYTGNMEYLAEYGLDVLIGISRFWAQRVSFSNHRNKYVILGVTGPNEYENNVNNNWYTNSMAVWTLKYTIESLEGIKNSHPQQYSQAILNSKFEYEVETKKWRDIIDKMYFPYDGQQDIFLQQDGFLDKEIQPVSTLDKTQLPINQNWSWDRILRSCYIKQADVLQGLYAFQEDHDEETIRRNFNFYEPITVHESSLSPCIHAILAAQLGMKEKAYEMYLRTARLDLDDYNNDTEDGCHTTSMAGTWMSVVKGFGGMKVKEGHLHFSPFVPEQWDAYSFRVKFRKHVIGLKIDKQHIALHNYSDQPIEVYLFGSPYLLEPEMAELVPAK